MVALLAFGARSSMARSADIPAPSPHVGKFNLAMDHRLAIKQAIDDEFRRSDPGGVVLCLAGPWGSGKTHLWRELNEDLVGSGVQTVYVSLFGVTSAAEIKSSLVNELVLSVRQDDETKAHTKLIRRTTEWFVKNASGIFQALDKRIGFELLTKNLDLTRLLPAGTVLCLDDLERVSEQFRIEEALGLANALAEHRGCRVLLIMNDEHLATRYPDQAPIIQAYRERVIKRLLRLHPQLADVYDHLPAARRTWQTPVLKAHLLRTVGRAQCTNIRTLARILDNINTLALALGSQVEHAHVQLLTAFTVEHAEGTLADATFYNFNADVLQYKEQLQPKTLDEQSARRLLFYRRYYGPEDPPYRFSPEVHRLIADGYVDPEQYRDEVNPRLARDLIPTDRLITAVSARDFFYFSDQEARTWLDAVTEAFNTTTVAPGWHVVTILKAAQTVVERLDEGLPEGLVRAAEDALVRAAIRLDTSADQLLHGPFENGLPSELVAVYDSAATQARSVAIKDRILQAILNHDIDGLLSIRGLEQAATLRAALDFPLLEELHASRVRNRRFYFDSLLQLANMVAATGDAPLTEHFRSYIAVCLAFERLDLSDKHRLLVVEKKLR